MREWIRYLLFDAAILRAVLIMTLSGGLLALVLFALKPLLRERLPKTAQYYLWIVVIAALLVPVSVILVLPSGGALPLPAAPIQAIVEQTVMTAEEEKDFNLGNIPPSSPPRGPQAQQENRWLSFQTSAKALAISVFVAAYPFGVLIVLLYYMISFAVFTRIRRRRNRPANADEIAALAALCRRRTPQLYRNPLAATPMLIGLFRPAIILPDRAYTPEQLHSVLRHELTHLRRKDVLVKWLSVLTCAVHWFNPVVWFTRREIDRACELSCDEAVIRNLNTDGKRIYGDTLIYVAADGKTPRAVLSTTMCEEKKALKERLGAIMKNKKRTRAALVLSATLMVAAVLAACALGAGRGHDADGDTIEHEPQVYINEEYGFSMALEADGDTIAIVQDADRGASFIISAPDFGLGAIAYIDIYPMATSYRNFGPADNPAIHLGVSDTYDFMLRFAETSDVYGTGETAPDAYVRLVAALRGGQFAFTLKNNLLDTPAAHKLDWLDITLEVPGQWRDCLEIVQSADGAVLYVIPRSTSMPDGGVIGTLHRYPRDEWERELVPSGQLAWLYASPHLILAENTDALVVIAFADDEQYNPNDPVMAANYTMIMNGLKNGECAVLFGTRTAGDTLPWQTIHIGATLEEVHAVLGPPDGGGSGISFEWYTFGDNTISLLYWPDGDGVWILQRITLNGQLIEGEIPPQPTYTGGKTLEDARILSDEFIEKLNSGVDLTGDEDAMVAWQAQLNFVQMPAHVSNLRAQEYSENVYAFEVAGLNGDTVREITVLINLQNDTPWYSCAYTHYYPYAQSTAETYLSLIAEGDLAKLGGWLSVDGGPQAPGSSHYTHAQESVAAYGGYDLAAAHMSVPVMYDNVRQHFQCVFQDGNGASFVITLICGDGLIRPIAPAETE
jgi:beta-lactamase regulating signal transducer with metallopeptidase domain